MEDVSASGDINFSVLSAFLAVHSFIVAFTMCAYHPWLITRNVYALNK